MKTRYWLIVACIALMEVQSRYCQGIGQKALARRSDVQSYACHRDVLPGCVSGHGFPVDMLHISNMNSAT